MQVPHLSPGWFTFLVPAYPGRPGKDVIKRVFVCVPVLQDWQSH